MYAQNRMEESREPALPRNAVPEKVERFSPASLSNGWIGEGREKNVHEDETVVVSAFMVVVVVVVPIGSTPR